MVVPKKKAFRKKLYFEEKFNENASNQKEHWRTMKSSRSRLPSEGGSQSRTTLKQNGVVNFDTKKSTFCNSFSQT